MLPLYMMLAACGDGGTEPNPTVTGTWGGNNGTITLTLTLIEAVDGTVTGSGNLAQDQNVALAVRVGTHVFPNLSLTLAPFGSYDLDLTGTVMSTTTIAATLNGSGYNNESIQLTRLPVG
ncbi:MAG: hypothetical protein CME12_08190 [Gemmatimonadetes bacterium]|nr:hypothetical protein [Gemmatimonadota bacterium]